MLRIPFTRASSAFPGIDRIDRSARSFRPVGFRTASNQLPGQTRRGSMIVNPAGAAVSNVGSSVAASSRLTIRSIS